MPGAIIFGDLIGKLEMLRVECPKCGRSGRYRLADLIMRYGRNGRLISSFDRHMKDLRFDRYPKRRRPREEMDKLLARAIQAYYVARRQEGVIAADQPNISDSGTETHYGKRY